jgi:hypothetical protein
VARPPGDAGGRGPAPPGPEAFSTTGSSTNVSARCAAAWCIARSGASTESACRRQDADPVGHLLDEAVLKEVLARLVALGRAQHLILGRRLRVDTTVVETNIHPTDATPGRRRPGAHAHPAAARGAGPRVHAQCRPPGVRDRPAQSHSRLAGEPDGPRAEQGEDENSLPGSHADHPCGGAPRRSGRDTPARPTPRGPAAHDD